MLWHDQRLPRISELCQCMRKQDLRTLSGYIAEWLRSCGTLQRWDEGVHAAAIVQSWLLQDKQQRLYVCCGWSQVALRARPLKKSPR